MNDYKTISKLFENDQDEIGFILFKEFNNNNYDNNQIEYSIISFKINKL